MRCSPLVLCLCVLCGVEALAVDPATNRIVVASWNLENLFDDVDDPLAVDDPGDLDDELAGWWTADLYLRKLTNLAEIVGRMNGGRGPDVLAVMEVESRKALTDLVSLLPDPAGYAIVHVEGDDHRGMEVAMLSRLPVVGHRSHFVLPEYRSILQVDLVVADQPLTVLVNHWKSRYGGVRKTVVLRQIYAARTYQVYRDLAVRDPAIDVIVCGDFNDNPGNSSLSRFLNASTDRREVVNQVDGLRLYNCTAAGLDSAPGTYVYQKKWSYLDQFIVSRGLLAGSGLRYRAGSLDVFTADDRLIRDGRPWRFGSRWTKRGERGYSDHLPLVAELEIVASAGGD